MENIKFIVQIISSVGTLFIASVVVYITYQQHKTNRDKLRLDLFEKRYKVFRTLMEFLAFIFTFGNADPKKIMTFKADTNDSIFLFEEEISSYIEKVYDKAWEIHSANFKLEHHKIREETQEQTDATFKNREEVWQWFSNELKKAPEIFKPYLKFKTKY